MNNFNELYNDLYKTYKKRYADNRDYELQSNQSTFNALKEIYIEYQNLKLSRNRRNDDNNSPSSSVCSEILEMLEIEDKKEAPKHINIPQFYPLQINRNNDGDLTLNNLQEMNPPLSDVDAFYSNDSGPKNKKDYYNNVAEGISKDEDSSISILKFSLSNSNSDFDNGNLPNNIQAQRFIESNIINTKIINLKKKQFLKSPCNCDFVNNDQFLKQSFNLLMNLNNCFFDVNIIENLKEQFTNRIELMFFDMIRILLLIKDAKQSNNINLIDSLSVEIETLYNLNISCLGAKIYLTESKDFYIYQPLTILKLWNKETDDTDVSTFSDLNFIFFVKSLIKIKKFEKAFKHLKSYIDNNSNNNCSSIFCYLFGKVIALAITFRICTGSLGNFLSQRSNYSMIKLTMISFGSDTKIKNYSRLEKNYRRLALISKYYKIEQGIIDNYLEKAKIYSDYVKNPNKLFS